MCCSRKYPCPPQGRLTEIPRGEGVSKAQFFEGKYDTNKNRISGGVRGGGGGGEVQFKKPSVGGGMDIFWNNIIAIHLVSHSANIVTK